MAMDMNMWDMGHGRWQDMARLSVNEFANVMTDCLSVDEFAIELTNCLSVDD
jgi:hypothetical protein